jgi:hypothetical protein
LTVNVKAAPPAVAADGEIELIDGTGLGVGPVLPLPPPLPPQPTSTNRQALAIVKARNVLSEPMDFIVPRP